MGYTHYWYRKVTFPAKEFENAAAICAQACYRLGIPLADWDGASTATFTAKEICFNGISACGHAPNSGIGIAWPAPNANGIAQPAESVESGEWFAGALLSKRTCDGDCSHESFLVPRVLKPESWQERKENGLYFQFCKTAFKPYDLAVQVCLLILARYLGPSAIKVSSDGHESEWSDARQFCQRFYGFGAALEGVSLR
jgi:hypothetical protein